jgi:hypothetical protein
MPQIIMDVIATHKQSPTTVSKCYANLFVEGGHYVFDGNRVIAHFRRGRNAVGQWWLETIDPSLSLRVTPDLRVRKYPRLKRVRMIRGFEAVFDTLKPLDEAVSSCAQHGHAWSPLQFGAGQNVACVWQWCVLCGVEEVQLPDSRGWLTWPDDASEIAIRTAGALPTLHGPVFSTERQRP